MKQNISFALALLLICFASYSCKDKITGSYMANTPIYQDFDSFRSKIFSLESPKNLRQPGKIWIKDQYLFINEVLKGIHIFDNTNPSNPINLGFLDIYANTDLAVKGHLLYADNYNDLLTFDISNPLQPELVCRSNNVFNFESAHNFKGFDPEYPSVGVLFEKGVITGWKQEKVTEEIGGVHRFENNDLITFDAQNTIGETANVNGISSINLGGSMARFTISGEHLHVIQSRSLTTYAISNDCPVETSQLGVWRVGETLFTAKNHLFIGTTTGMLIYDLIDPANPSFLSDYPHVGSCDPVIVKDDRAYVTLRTGNRCSGDIDELVIVDVSDLSQPHEIATYQMTNPHGLGMDGTTLFLCDGEAGLKVFNASNDLSLENNLLSHFQNIRTYDVIPFNDNLIMSAKEGIYQYDYSDLNNITEVSLIPVN